MPLCTKGDNCPYFTIGAGCSDAITWENSFSSQAFTASGKQYSLELVGFANSMNDKDLVNTFVSQERKISQAQLFTRVTELGSGETADVPEPTGLLGLGLLSTYAIARRRRHEINLIPV